MLFKKIKPTTPSLRHLIQLKKNLFFSKFPKIKSRIKGKKNSSGRNNRGKITMYHRGGGHKQNYRIINFFKTCSNYLVTNIEYDPNRTANIMSVYDFATEKYDYFIAPKNLKPGDLLKTGKNIGLETGNQLSLKKIPAGTYVHNISVNNKKATLTRSAGTYSIILKNDSKKVELKLSSGKVLKISSQNFATIGIVSNELINITTIGKAGRSRWLNKRPVVRGVAMNPVDHPHGGGEGKTSGGRPSVTPWGKPTKL